MARDSFFERALTKVALETLEGGIADALSEMVGRRYEVQIKRLDLEPHAISALADEYEVVIDVRRASADLVIPEQEAATNAGTGANLQLHKDAQDEPRERTVTGLTGRQLNAEWQVGARHALYHHEGFWYHQLRHFPAALFDYNGYVLFPTEAAFRTD